MLSLISFMIFLGETLLEPKASMIFPLELCEKDMIYLVFQVMRLFLREYAEGTLLQSITMNSLFKKTLMSTSYSLCLHFSFILYLKVNSMLLLLTYRVYTKRRGILSGVNDSLRMM